MVFASLSWRLDRLDDISRHSTAGTEGQEAGGQFEAGGKALCGLRHCAARFRVKRKHISRTPDMIDLLIYGF